jgi:hypothetical protein
VSTLVSLSRSRVSSAAGHWRIRSVACCPPRKDRVKRSRGAQFLRGHKIREKSATNRVVATCCNSAVFVNFDDGKHWVDIYRARFQGDIPPLQMRICTKFKPENGDVPNDVPSYPTFPLRFLAKLLAARIAMLLYR